MLILAREKGKLKARRDLVRLKEQRAEKRRKDELAMKQQLVKASEEHVENMFLYDMCIQGECYKTVDEVERGISGILTQTGKLKELKRVITIYVKGLGWSEYHTPWSIRIDGKQRQHTVGYLKNHLIHIITDSTAKNKQVIKPSINVASRKDLPSLGVATVDVRETDEKDNLLINEMNDKCSEERLRLINQGIRDEMRLRQPSYAPDLCVGNKIKYAFRCTEDNGDDEIIEWCTGEVTKISTGSNLRNTGAGPKYCRKGGAVEVQWEADLSKGEEVSYSIVEIKKSLFNCYEEFGWRLFFDIPWNSIPLQAAYEAKEKIAESEFANDI